MAKETQRTMPVGSPMSEIRRNQVTTTPGAELPPVYEDDAAAKLVWDNYNEARNYIENKAWLLSWQETDVLYQPHTQGRNASSGNDGRNRRVPRFIVAKNARTMSRAVKRAIFAEQTPFMLRPTGDTPQQYADAWTELISKLLKRMSFEYCCGLLIDTQALQGTGIGVPKWITKKVVKRKRVRKKAAPQVDLPSGPVEVPTKKSDEFITTLQEVEESWPVFEYRRLGTTLFDPKWCTPDRPDLSSGYSIDIDYVTFADLAVMRESDCYHNIPPEETLIDYFFQKHGGSAPQGTQVASSMTAQGGIATHAEGENQQTNKTPLETPLMLLEQSDERTVKTVLCYDGRYLCVRNEDHQLSRDYHLAATWWPIDNCGYGIGIGVLNSGDQRVNQAILNECLKMIAYPFNAPILTRRGENAPTQNVIQRLGGYWAVDAAAGEDVRKAAAFMPMPEIPPEAWKMLELSQQGSEELTGANSQFQQGNLGGPGSSAARTATGAARIASMSDQSIADAVNSVANGVVIPTIQFLIECVKEKMPLQEIREMLSKEHADIIEKSIQMEQFLNAEFEVTVLAGQKLIAKQGIQQLIPFLLQLVQQPQLLQFYHEKGETLDYSEILDLLMQVSELQQQPTFFKPMTSQQQQSYQQAKMGPAMAKIQADTAKEKLRGANKLQEIDKKGQVDVATKMAEIGAQKLADGIPLERAEGLVERGQDEKTLQNGFPDLEMQ